MRPTTLFLTASLLAFAFAAAFLIAPGAMLHQYGISADPSTVLLSRFFAGALVQLAITVYLLRDVREAATIRAIAIGGTLASACGTLVALVGVLNGVTNSLGWTTVAIYGLLFAGYAGCLRA
ncbi:MAG: hypothetical protein ABJD11_17015, partial [Gemmatimonadota bacterium]